MEKNGCNSQATTTQEDQLNDTSSGAQRGRVLRALEMHGSLDTVFIRSHLNCMMPAARIRELRKLGYNITTTRVSVVDANGFKHSNVARYTLVTGGGV